MSEKPDFRPSRTSLPTTRWSRVAAATDASAADAREALAELFAAYWYPVYATIRRRGKSPELARDLTQDYFVHLLEKGTLAAADMRRGRFRSFVKSDCAFFLSHLRDSDQARKQGGGVASLSIDARDAEERYLREPADDVTPDVLFDRSWAVSLLSGVYDRLAAEYAAAGRSPQFECLQGVLGQGPHLLSYTTMAGQLGMSEAGIHQAASRLRKRYRAILREQVAETLHQPTDQAIDEEVAQLFDALAT